MLEVVRAQYQDGYRIWLEFNDGVSGVVDLSDALWGPVFEPLKDLDQFKRFAVSDVLHTLVWENDADLRRNACTRKWPLSAFSRHRHAELRLRHTDDQPCRYGIITTDRLELASGRTLFLDRRQQIPLRHLLSRSVSARLMPELGSRAEIDGQLQGRTSCLIAIRRSCDAMSCFDAAVTGNRCPRARLVLADANRVSEVLTNLDRESDHDCRCFHLSTEVISGNLREVRRNRDGSEHTACYDQPPSASKIRSNRWRICRVAFS